MNPIEKITIESAKQFLKDNGYYTDILWCVDDVKSKYNCTDKQAQEVLNSALNNECTMEQIWFAIDMDCEINNIPKISKYFKISGFWKDDKVKFENYIVKEFDDVDEDDDTEIFYYGLSASDIEELIIEKWNSEHEFVITSYEETTLN